MAQLFSFGDFDMFLISQPAFYSPFWWLVFATIAYCTARYARWWCILIGYAAVAVITYIVDVAWVRYEMSQPGWDDSPDMDVVFAVGLFLRILLVSIALLPVAAIGIWLRRRGRVRRSERSRAEPIT